MSCPRQTFNEQVPQITARFRLTVRLRQAAGAAMGDGGRTVIQSARDHRVSWPIVSAAFTEHAHRVLPAQPCRSSDWASMRSVVAVLAGLLDEATGTWTTPVDR
ncbi:helix-turn-helix domain-containing protein [Nonomuraea sp. JJY05]|uniref:helix-turn-helix domain-containing protein n=1 Tax=Nonomuraea sp. JJY05 TaxID=3350255 RepID=UPI00373ECC06